MRAISVGRPLRRLPTDDCGVAAIEFALLLPLLAAISLGTLDLAVAAAKARQVQGLADEGAAALATRLLNSAPPHVQSLPANTSLPANSWSAAASAPLPQIPLAAVMPDLPADVSATARQFRACASPAGLASAASSACPGGLTAALHVELVVTAPVTRLIAWPDRILSGSVEGRAVVRVG